MHFVYMPQKRESGEEWKKGRMTEMRTVEVAAVCDCDGDI